MVVLLSFVVFLAIDNAVFRSGFYSRWESTKGIAGHFEVVARLCMSTPPSPKRDVLVLGHSKIDSAFSARQFDENNPDSQLRMIVATSGWTTEKDWFYLLKHIDPNRDRFAGIVIPIDSYTTQALGDCDDRIADAQMVMPILEVKDWREFAGSYTNPSVREKVLLGMAASSHLYAVDVQDFLLHPEERIADLEWAKNEAARYLYNWEGHEGTLDELVVDPTTRKITHAPPQIDSFKREEAEVRLVAHPGGDRVHWTADFQAFRKHWLTDIIDYYAGSKTKVVFVQVPRWPFDMPVLDPIPGAPSLLDFVKPSPNVVIEPEREFEDLESPHYFYDVLHVNTIARRLFTARFGKDLRAALGD